MTGTDERTAYAGLATRSIAFVIDALIVNAVAALVTAGIGIAASVLVGDPTLSPPGVLAGAAVFALWSTSYFVISWSINGQTIGDVVMGIRVVGSRDGRPLRPCRATVRFLALSLGALPCLIGLWLLLWDERRRALHDRIARTVVVRTDDVGRRPTTPRAAATPGDTGRRSSRFPA